MVEDAHVSVDDGGSLAFSSVFSTDAGSYTCFATNAVGNASANTILTVLGEWVITESVAIH